MIPGVQRRPTRPQNEDGRRIEPPVSSPMPRRPRSAATAAPVPELEPPGSRFRSYGLRVTPEIDDVECHDVAQSILQVNRGPAWSHMGLVDLPGMLVLASTMAPAAFSLATRVASSVGM